MRLTKPLGARACGACAACGGGPPRLQLLPHRFLQSLRGRARRHEQLEGGAAECVLVEPCAGGRRSGAGGAAGGVGGSEHGGERKPQGKPQNAEPRKKKTAQWLPPRNLSLNLSS